MVVADEYTKYLRDVINKELYEEELRRLRYFSEGGLVNKCKPFTPGGMKAFSVAERPERNVIATRRGIKVKLTEEE